MNLRLFLTAARNRPRQVTWGIAKMFGLSLLMSAAFAGPITLGTAGDYSLLAGTTITNTGFTVIDHGNIGVSPGATVTGFPPGVLTAPYTMHLADAPAQQAQTDLTTAYNVAAGLASTQDLTGQDLGGLTLTPGVYSFASSAQLTGTLTLNYLGDPNALFVFQVGSTLDTAANSAVVSVNNPGTPGIGVFWQVGSAATLGASTTFEGNILAMSSITAETGAIVDGRLLARNEAITLNENVVTAPLGSGGSAVPDSGSTRLLLVTGVITAGLLGRAWRRARADAPRVLHNGPASRFSVRGGH